MANYNRKPQIYKGKEYKSIKALAEELGINQVYLGAALKKGMSTEDAVNFVKNSRPSRGTNYRRPLYVTSTGDKIWTYTSLAMYLGIHPKELMELRVRFGTIEEVISHVKNKHKGLSRDAYKRLVSKVSDFIIDTLAAKDGLDIFNRKHTCVTKYFTRSLPTSMNGNISSIKGIPRFLIDVSDSATDKLEKILPANRLCRISCTLKWMNSTCDIKFIVNI